MIRNGHENVIELPSLLSSQHFPLIKSSHVKLLT